METLALVNQSPSSWFRHFWRDEKELARPTVEHAIAEVREPLVSRLNAGDLDRWASLFADDAVQMPPHAPANQGQNSIRAWGGKLLRCMQMRASLSPDDFRASEDLTVETGTYDSTMTVRGTGEVVTDCGKYLMVYCRDAKNRWVIARDIWNSDKPDLAFRTSAS